MRARTAAWGLVCLAIACAVAQGWLLWAAGIELWSAQAVDEAFPVVTLAMVICVAMGAAIVARLPSNRIGWLLLLQVGAGLGLVAGQLAPAAAAPDSPLPGWTGGWATLLSKVFGVPWALGCLALVFLLMPDGRLWTRRWRAAGWLIGGFFALTVASLLLIGPVAPGEAGIAGGAPRWLRTAYDLGQVGIVLSLVPALACLLRRSRRATGIERQQLTWVLAGAAALLLGAAVYLGYATLAGPSGAGLIWVELLFFAGYMAVPVCAGVAVLKYHLFDADRAVSRGVRLAAMAVLVTAGYVVAVTTIEAAAGALVPQPWNGVGASVAAFVMVVVGLQPLRDWLRRFSDRVVYGARATPYQALADVIGGMPGSGSPRDLLARVAGAAAAAGNGTATASLLLPGGADLDVTSRNPGEPPAHPSAAQTWDVSYSGQTVGRLEVVPGAAGLSPDQQRLFAAFADEAGLAFHNAWLQAELTARAAALASDTAALAESRRRLASVGYAERDRLSATIHRDVVVHLSCLKSEVPRIRQLLPEHPDDAAARLDRARAEVNAALDRLRALTRSVYPAVLARRGLTAAIRSAASEGAAGAQLETYGPVDRLPEELATTAYFAAVDSLRDLGGAGRVALTVDQVLLRIDITGKPCLQPSSAAVRDRVEAMGGTVESREQGGRCTVVVTLPLNPPNRVAAGSS